MENLKLESFNFFLPQNLIAQNPLHNKTDAKMLVVQNGTCKDSVINKVTDYLQAGDLLIFNDTKVIPARLKGKRGEARVIITLHYRLTEDTWLAFAKNSKKLQAESEVYFAENFKAKVLQKLGNGEIKLQFFSKSLGDLDLPKTMLYLSKYGFIPLPPYIKRENINNTADAVNYQTIFAKVDGAVASPTASLHFTEKLLQSIKDKGIKIAFVTLHVGAGTFLPVKVENIVEHKIHKEYGKVNLETANLIKATKAKGGRIIAAGTTSLRILEYIAKATGEIKEFEGEIDLFIYPSFQFKIVDCLLTNFHLPKSTLFMLVSAFMGLETMQGVYAHAITNQYRFFSYGDCCFLINKPPI